MKESSKHEKEQIFKIDSFAGGLNQGLTTSHFGQGLTELYDILNMQYFEYEDAAGEKKVGLRQRRGTTKISTAALPGAADVKACYYYKSQTQYILATATKLYYLGSVVGALDPIEIGTISGIPTFTEFNGKLIIHDSGTTKAWNGTTFETLACTYEDEVIETGDGVTVAFTGTITNTTITTSSVTITYLDASGNTKTITDNGEGALIGDVDTGETRTINYTSGAYVFTASVAPADGTSVTVTYKKVAGAPKSKGGFVRNERLYMWGSSDYPSRLYYSGTSDTGGEYEWDTSSGGGYLDFDKDDGYAITTCINFSQSVIVMKENKAGRLDNFPGDSIFRIEPLNGNIQCNAYRSACLGGGIIAYQSPSDISAISPEGLYNEDQQILSLTKKFQRYGKTYNGSATQIEYYPTDGQLWIALGTGSTATLSTIYIIDIPSGRTTQYIFSFTCTCMKYIDGMMLLGSTLGELYQFNEPTFSENNYLDNGTPKFQTGALDFGFPMNDKISKEIYLRFDCSSATLGTLTAYTDFSSTASLTKTLPASSSVHSDDDRTKLRYRNLSIKVTGIQSANPISIYGIYLKTAIIGE